MFGAHVEVWKDDNRLCHLFDSSKCLFRVCFAHMNHICFLRLPPNDKTGFFKIPPITIRVCVHAS
jgi:hypothetical protein